MVISTKGDRVLDKSLPEIGGKGLFTQELESALINKTVDIAVHSAKDLPTSDPEGLCITAFLKRERPSDCLVSPLSNAYASIEELPVGFTIGTSSLRRQAQVLNLRPDLRVKSIRGNVDTRINKMLAGDADALLLASAGIIRLGYETHSDIHVEHLNEEDFLPAVGQGSVAIQCRLEDLEFFKILRDNDSHKRVLAERELLRRLEGGCSLPLGVRSYCSDETKVFLHAKLLSPDGTKSIEAFGEGAELDSVDQILSKMDQLQLSEIRKSIK